MRTFNYFLAGALLLTACVEKMDTSVPEQSDSGRWEAEFGQVDPNQTWNMAAKANLSISAREAGTIEVFTQNPIIEGSMLLMRKQVEAGAREFAFDVPQGTETVFVQLCNEHGPYVNGYLPLDGTAAAAGAVQAPATRADGCPAAVKPETLDITVTNNLTKEKITTPFHVLENVAYTPNKTFWKLTDFAPLFTRLNKDMAKVEKNVIYTFAEDGTLEMNLLFIDHTLLWGSPNRFGILILDDDEPDNREKARKYIVADISRKDVYRDDEGDFAFGRTYRIPYVDAEGNTTYTFPKGTKIAFFNWAKDWKGMPKQGHVNYSVPGWNQEVGFTPEGSETAYQGAATFRYGKSTYIGFEDDFNAQECDINDLLFTINANFEETAPLVPKTDEEVEPMTWTLAYEDQIGDKSDFDFNDVVIRVAYVAGEETAEVTYCAAGGTFKSELFFDETSLGLVHDKLGDPGHTALINTYHLTTKFVTKAIEVPAAFCLSSDAPRFRIKTEYHNGFLESQLPTAAAYGSVPHGLCVPGNWAWPREGLNIKQAYPQFEEWVNNASAAQEWYKTGIQSAVVNE